MASASFDPGDFLFVLAIYGIPFLVFAYMVWTGRWSELTRKKPRLTTRQMIAFGAEIAGALAAGMFLLNLPLWMLMASHESFGNAWHFAGLLTSIVALACALAGSPLLWRHAIASGLLLPFWIVNLGLFVKAMMD